VRFNVIAMLAEISDKMPSGGEIWMWKLFLSAPALIGLIWRKLAGIVLVVCVAVSALICYFSYHEAFLEAGFSDAVQSEMGEVWIANSIASSFLPAAVGLVVFCWVKLTSKKKVLTGESTDSVAAEII
jgi:hypothetical protein